MFATIFIIFNSFYFIHPSERNLDFIIFTFIGDDE